ncbi:MAG: hypothetical protein KF716_08785 [Anaerolineae bacterium]|nr:hypothetical protein [Anaerolineae bacterium]
MTNNGTGPKQGLNVTSAREWRKLRKEGVLVSLPSGMVARLRPVSLMDLLRSGGIPETLGPMVADLLINGEVTAPREALTADLVATAADLYTRVCKAAFVAPAIVDKPTDDADEIEMEDVSQSDREFVLAWCNTPTTELRDFRHEQGQQNPPVEPVEPIASLRAKAESATSDS